MSISNRILGGVGLLSLMVAVGTTKECSGPKKETTDETAESTTLQKPVTKVRTQIEDTLEEDDALSLCFSGQKEYFAALSVGELDGSDEVKELELRYLDCQSALNHDQQRWLKGEEVERKARMEEQFRCFDQEEDCEEWEVAFVEALEQNGIQGWTWNSDFQFNYNEDGLAEEAVAYPGFELELPSRQEGHYDVIHLNTLWNGEEPVVTFEIVHSVGNEVSTSNLTDDILSENMNQDSFNTILGLWKQGEAQ